MANFKLIALLCVASLLSGVMSQGTTGGDGTNSTAPTENTFPDNKCSSDAPTGCEYCARTDKKICIMCAGKGAPDYANNLCKEPAQVNFFFIMVLVCCYNLICLACCVALVGGAIYGIIQLTGAGKPSYGQAPMPGQPGMMQQGYAPQPQGYPAQQPYQGQAPMQGQQGMYQPGGYAQPQYNPQMYG